MELPGQEDRISVQVIAKIVRSRSKSGRLLSRDELYQELLNRHRSSGDKDEDRNVIEALIDAAVKENEDLGTLQTPDGHQHFFSSQFMSEAYARILTQKGLDPVFLMAEIIRENSAIYPRPVPLALFTDSPFELTHDQIQDCLSRMAQHDEYRDIKQTQSSLGTVFLYSTLHLEPGYASMLAEWIDVGQANNP